MTEIPSCVLKITLRNEVMYYKKMKVFFEHVCMLTNCRRLKKNKTGNL